MTKDDSSPKFDRRSVLKLFGLGAAAPKTTMTELVAPAVITAATSLAQTTGPLLPAQQAFLAVTAAQAVLKQTEEKVLAYNDDSPAWKATALIRGEGTEHDPQKWKALYEDEMVRMYRGSVEGLTQYYNAIKIALGTKDGFKQFSKDMQEIDGLHEIERRLAPQSDKDTLAFLENIPPEVATAYNALRTQAQKQLDVIAKRYHFTGREELLAFRDSIKHFMNQKDGYERLSGEAVEAVAKHFLFTQSITLMAKKLGCNSADLIPLSRYHEGGYNEAQFGTFVQKEIELQFADAIFVAATGKPVSQEMLGADAKQRHARGTIDTHSYEQHSCTTPNMFESVGVSAQQKAYRERRASITLYDLNPYRAELNYLGKKPGCEDTPIADLYKTKVPYIAGLNEAERVAYFNKSVEALGGRWKASLDERPAFGEPTIAAAKAKNGVRPEKLAIIDGIAPKLLQRVAIVVIIESLLKEQEAPAAAPSAPVAASQVAPASSAIPVLAHQEPQEIIPAATHRERVGMPAASWQGAAEADKTARNTPREPSK